MYGFRKPFTVGSFTDPVTGQSLKAWLITAQVLGYMLSKFIGIRVIAEMKPERRAVTFLGLIACAEIALLLFALLPTPFNLACLFLNGLPLGLVFGLVLGFLEGRQLTEAFVAGLCASFILADGIAKSVGAALLQQGVAENWMPFAAGLVFLLPLVGFVWMLSHIPKPNAEDLLARSERTPMDAIARQSFVRRHGLGLALITIAYLLVTILRSVRADFAPEIWSALGVNVPPGLFTRSELWVTLGIVFANGLLVLVRDNARALLLGLFLSAFGLLLVAFSVRAWQWHQLTPFQFMVLLGLGLYLPYVAVHTTVFERLMALSRDRGNIGYLMYRVDAIGYLGYVGVIIGKNLFNLNFGSLDLLLNTSLVVAIFAVFSFLGAAFLYMDQPPASAKDSVNPMSCP